MEEKKEIKKKEIKSKEPLLAVMFSTAFIGLGQVYVGRWKRAIVLLLVYILYTIGVVTFILHPSVKMEFYSWVGIIYIGYTIFVLLDAYLCAKKFNLKHQVKPSVSWVRRIILSVAIISFLAIINVQILVSKCIYNYMVEPLVVPAVHMDPTLVEGDHVFIDKMIYHRSEPQRGDVVVFIDPKNLKKHYIKRIVGLPQEIVKIREGKLIVNERVISTPTIFKSLQYTNKGTYGQADKKVKVANSAYFLLGDNSEESYDSRIFGSIPKEYIVGKIYKVYYPHNRAGMVE